MRNRQIEKFVKNLLLKLEVLENSTQEKKRFVKNLHEGGKNLMFLSDEKFINRSRRRINSKNRDHFFYKKCKWIYDYSTKYAFISISYRPQSHWNARSFYDHFFYGLNKRSLNEKECLYLENSSVNDIIKDLKKFKNTFSLSKKIVLGGSSENRPKIKIPRVHPRRLS